MAIKFGAKQLKNPTPANWSNAINVLSVILGVIIAWLGTANFIPANTSSIIQSICGLFLAIVNGLKPFLGVETTQSDVPISEVTAMNADTTTK